MEHVGLDEAQKVLFHLKGCKLIEIEQPTEEESDARLSILPLDAILRIFLHKLDLSFKNLLVDLERQLMNYVDVRIQALGW